MTLIWTDNVQEEIRDIYSYLYDLSPALADDWSDEVPKKADTLISFPEIGHSVPELDVSFIREVFVRKYRMVYSYQDDTVRILAVRPMGGSLGRI